MQKAKVVGIIAIILVSTLIPIWILSNTITNEAQSYISYVNSNEISYLKNSVLFDNNITLKVDSNDEVNLSIFLNSAELDVSNRSLAIRLKGENITAHYYYEGLSYYVGVLDFFEISNISLLETNITLNIKFGSITNHVFIISAYILNIRESEITIEDLEVFALKTDLDEVNLLISSLNSSLLFQSNNITYLYLVYNSLNQTLNDSIDYCENLNESINTLESNINLLNVTLESDVLVLNQSILQLNDYYNELNSTLNEIGNLEEKLNDLNNSISIIDGMYDSMLILYTFISANMSIIEQNLNDLIANYTILYNNFDEYVEILNSLSDVPEMLESINDEIGYLYGNLTIIEGDISTIEGDISDIEGDISTIEGDISDIEGDILTLDGLISDLDQEINALDSRIDTLEAEKIAIPPLFTDYLNGWTSGSYNVQCMYATHADTDARIDACFYVSVSSYYKIYIIHASNTNSRTDDGLLYCGTMLHAESGSVTNRLNAANFDLTNNYVNVIYQSTHANSIYIASGSSVFCAWVKTENEGSGELYSYGIILKEV